MIKTTLQRGFTLIELLVVIAIIGILAAVVIGSLNDARSTGLDASIKQSVANVRQQAEIVYNEDNFTYSGVCSAQRVNDLLIAAVGVLNGNSTSTTGGNDAGTATSRVAGCQSNDTAWAALAPLTDDSYTQYWCVDSTGASRQVSSALPAVPNGTVCPAS